MTETKVDLPQIELVTETSWISGHLARDQASDAANLVHVLNLGEYGLRGRSLIESGRLVDVLNKDQGYLSVSGARIQPLFPLELLDRAVAQVAVRTSEVLCAAPMQPRALAHSGGHGQPGAEAGDLARERRLVEVQIGPILVRGDLHVIPGSDPVAAFFQRDFDFVPLTSATATYLPVPQRKWVREVLIVNMRRAQILLAPASEDAAPETEKP